MPRNGSTNCRNAPAAAAEPSMTARPGSPAGRRYVMTAQHHPVRVSGRAVTCPPARLRARRGTISRVPSRPAATQQLRDLALRRRVRDRMDREYAQPLDVEALARGVNMSAGHLSRAFRAAYGESPYSYLMTRRIERAMTLLRRGDLSVT